MRRINLTCANSLELNMSVKSLDPVFWMFCVKYYNFIPWCTVRKTNMSERLSRTVVRNCKVEIDGGDKLKGGDWRW